MTLFEISQKAYFYLLHVRNLINYPISQIGNKYFYVGNDLQDLKLRLKFL